MNELVSVIMPIFNGEKYLKEAIESILNQTFTDFEFIIIDDGSSDNSLDIIKSFKDERIILIKNNENKGISYSLNKGVEVAKGKYIARMDADDIALPNRLEMQLSFLEKNPTVDLIGCSVEWIDELGKSQSVDVRNYNHEMIECLLVFTCPLYHPTIIGKKSVFTTFGYNSTYDGMEDWELWTRMVRQYKIINIPEVLLKYRLHESNASKIKQPSKTQKLSQLLGKQLNHYLHINDFKSINIHTATCTDTISTSIVQSDITNSKIWLSNLIDLNDKESFFNDDVFSFIINQTWYNFINRTIKNRNYSIVKLLIFDTLNLSTQQIVGLLLKGIYHSKLNVITSILKPIYKRFSTI